MKQYLKARWNTKSYEFNVCKIQNIFELPERKVERKSPWKPKCWMLVLHDVYMGNFLGSNSLSLKLVNEVILFRYLSQAPNLLGPNKILTQYHCKQNFWMKSRNCFDIFSPIMPLANLYISVTRNCKFRVWIEAEQSFLQVHEMLSAYRYRSVISWSLFILLLSIPAMAHPNQRAVAKLWPKKDTE